MMSAGSGLKTQTDKHECLSYGGNRQRVHFEIPASRCQRRTRGGSEFRGARWYDSTLPSGRFQRADV